MVRSNVQVSAEVQLPERLQKLVKKGIDYVRGAYRDKLAAKLPPQRAFWAAMNTLDRFLGAPYQSLSSEDRSIVFERVKTGLHHEQATAKAETSTTPSSHRPRPQQPTRR
jgi:hypothetical protein